LRILQHHQVAFLLIGGMNFLLRHQPILTFDIDFWIDDDVENRRRCERALADLGAEWGETDANWGKVSQRAPGWLDRQAVYCLTTPFGAVDIFRAVAGLGSWTESRTKAVVSKTDGGVEYAGICDEDMLKCQYALRESERKLDRIRVLEAALGRGGQVP
jgi:hypothetical protein